MVAGEVFWRYGIELEEARRPYQIKEDDWSLLGI
jgi:hypothetical protein